MPGRNTVSSGYMYGFQGQEKDDELKGEGNSYAFEYRIHDPRIGWFFSMDPLSKKFAFNSPYSFSENRVMDAIEFEGLEAFRIIANQDGKTERLALIDASAPFSIIDSDGSSRLDFKYSQWQKEMEGWRLVSPTNANSGDSKYNSEFGLITPNDPNPKTKVIGYDDPEATFAKLANITDPKVILTKLNAYTDVGLESPTFSSASENLESIRKSVFTGSPSTMGGVLKATRYS